MRKVFVALWTLSGFFVFGASLVLLYPYLWLKKFDEKEVRHFFYLISRTVMAMVRFVSKSYKVEILGSLPSGGALIAANHSSILDILCWGEFGLKDVIFISKGWPLKVPVMGKYLRSAGSIVLEDNVSVENLKNEAQKAFDKGLKIVVFPEGTRSVDNKVHRFRSGAFLLAQECNVPVIPAALKGLGQAIPKHCVVVRPSDIKLTLLEAVAPFEKGDISALNMAKYVKNLIIKELAR
ncbi:MAG: 1-acyl-sn-glycerol-3-phosphate acyltransferase [Elusimicrobiota bacterium]|jgi:1-acyl-sn-glycerol-3-phosphate acyltransferase|nr:1-acyl-sn-glycerol-3-phosphate acyltransferase [Elusimicrobiota bacterium]